MKYLDQKTSEYLVSLGCTSESGKYHELLPYSKDVWTLVSYSPEVFAAARSIELPIFPAFTLEDILRKDNAEKIWPNGTQCLVVGVPHDGSNHDCSEFTKIYWREKLDLVLAALHAHPDTWPQKVADLINPPQEKL